MTFVVDYQDHYAYFDKKISVYNFLQYSEMHWKHFNSSLHYQNRLRHIDYTRLFEDAGFDVLEENVSAGSEADLKSIRSLTLDPLYDKYELSDLAAHDAFFVLRKEL